MSMAKSFTLIFFQPPKQFLYSFDLSSCVGGGRRWHVVFCLTYFPRSKLKRAAFISSKPRQGSSRIKYAGVDHGAWPMKQLKPGRRRKLVERLVPRGLSLPMVHKPLRRIFFCLIGRFNCTCRCVVKAGNNHVLQLVRTRYSLLHSACGNVPRIVWSADAFALPTLEPETQKYLGVALWGRREPRQIHRFYRFR